MDGLLWEVYESGEPEDEVSVILRLQEGAEPPPNLRIVSRFGDVATARLRRGEIVSTRNAPGVASLKASGHVAMPLTIECCGDDDGEGAAGHAGADASEVVKVVPPPPPAAAPPPGETGRGVVVGILDWGFDFTHPNFRNADGSTRLEALWDQRGTGEPAAPAPYHYGRVLSREDVNAALAQPDPCEALGYHPADGDPTEAGSHGTHVADILAGNRREPGSEVGLASEADIIFVNLGSQQMSELADLGDSVGLLEGLDFVRQRAAGRPCVLHLSAGKTGGPHLGTTLLERAVDWLLAQPNMVLVQSVGNYADSSMHTHARIGPAQTHSFDWVTPDNDRTPNELEIWYSGHDVFDVILAAPGGRDFSTPLDSRLRLEDGGSTWGNLYHRRHEPNSGLNHVLIYLYPNAPSGQWRVTVHGRDVVDGRLHAWIERDATGRYQSRFPRPQATTRFTTNTICNCFRAIAVGACDGTRPDRPPTRFTSRGPTADGRQKPEIAAPGYRIRAARSVPRNGWQGGEPRLTVKSGTSMAAPAVSGTVALMMAAAGRPLSIHEIRRALIGSADPHPGPSGRSSTQLGYGYLNTAAAVAAARRMGQEPPAVPTPALSMAAPPLPREEPQEAEVGWPPVALEADAPEAEEEVAVMEDCGCAPGEAVASEEEWEEEEGEAPAPFGAEEEPVDLPFSWEEVSEAIAGLEGGDIRWAGRDA
jgi:subtilisin family serine protease